MSIEETVDKKVIGKVFQRIAVLLELSGENEFRTRAYLQGARLVEKYVGELDDLVRDAVDGKIKGIGKALSGKIEILVRTGGLPYLAELEQSFPAGLTELLDVPGLGAKSVRKLYKTIGVETIGDLEEVCESGEILQLPGFSEKSRDKILEGIRNLRGYEDRFRLHKAMESAAHLASDLAPLCEKIEVCGSVRRRRETVKDIDLLLAAADKDSLTDGLRSLSSVEKVVRESPTRLTGNLVSGIPFEIVLTEPENWSAALLFMTGVREHTDRLGRIARERGFDLSENGFFDRNRKRIGATDEREIYLALGLDHVPPELRENLGEIEAAAAKTLPRLVATEDLVGVIHAHTQYSDGTAGVAKMAKMAASLGFHYLAVSDHSKSAAIANGMKEDNVRKQHEEIDRFNETQTGFRVLKGVESDILKDGSLDYSDKVLASFEFIIASIHSNFGMSRDDMTKRIVTAVRNPHTTILGHPTGRILLHREPYQVDVEKVIEACGESGCAIEINANPYRLDLDWRLVRKAIGCGVKLAVGPDAHTEDQIHFTAFGVDVARKGWAETADILNCLDAGGFVEFAEKKRRK